MARRNARRIKSGWWDSYSAFPVVIKAQLWESQFICWESPSANRVIMGKYQEKSPFWDGLRRLHEKVDHQRAQALFYRKKKSVLMRLLASLWPLWPSWFLSKQKSFPLNLSWLEPGLYPTYGICGDSRKMLPFPIEVHVRQWQYGLKGLWSRADAGFLDLTLVTINHESRLHLLRAVTFSISRLFNKSYTYPLGKGSCL